MMNTLANHGFIPHDGKNLARESITNGLNMGLNFNEDLRNVTFDQAHCKFAAQCHIDRSVSVAASVAESSR